MERLGEYTDAVERLNIELSIRNKLELLDSLGEYFSQGLPVEEAEAAADPESARRLEALDLVERVRARWQYLLSNQATRLNMQCPHCANLWSTDSS